MAVSNYTVPRRWKKWNRFCARPTSRRKKGKLRLLFVLASLEQPSEMISHKKGPKFVCRRECLETPIGVKVP